VYWKQGCGTGKAPTHQWGLHTKLGTKWNKYQEKCVTSKARDDGRAIRSICRFASSR